MVTVFVDEDPPELDLTSMMMTTILVREMGASVDVHSVEWRTWGKNTHHNDNDGGKRGAQLALVSGGRGAHFRDAELFDSASSDRMHS